MAAVADHKGISPEKMDVRIERETVEGSPWRTSFVVHVDLGEGITDRERAVLYNSARQCEVRKLLTGEVQFDYECSARSRGRGGLGAPDG